MLSFSRTLQLHFTASLLHFRPPEFSNSPANSPFTNVVGYQNIKATPGYQFFTVTFENLSNVTKFNLSDIGFTKTNGDAWLRTGPTLNSCAGALYVRKIGADGAYGTQYKYYGRNATDTFGPGWYEGTRLSDGSNLITKENDITINKGEGLIVYLDKAKTEGGHLVLSGNVNLEPFGNQVSIGYSFGGNCTPADLKLSAITCKKYDGTSWLRTGPTLNSCGGALYIRKIGADGAYGTQYKYYGRNAADTFGPGWYEGTRLSDGSNLITEANDVTFAPGEGWIMYLDKAKTEGALITIPSPVK